MASCLPPGDFGDRFDDVGVGAAAADVAAHALTQLGLGETHRRGQVSGYVAWNTVLDLLQHTNTRADLPGRAVPALVAVVLDERGLHRVQVLRRAEAFNRGDAVTLVHHGEGQARIDPPPIDDHR